VGILEVYATGMAAKYTVEGVVINIIIHVSRKIKYAKYVCSFHNKVFRIECLSSNFELIGDLTAVSGLVDCKVCGTKNIYL
jgi:hypothetical protein